jgi:hypothetical protein
MGRGSRTESSVPDRFFSSSMFRIEGCRKRTALIVCTGDDDPEDEHEREHDLERVVDEDDDDADEERRIDVRMLLGEKRERIIWKREDCIFAFRVIKPSPDLCLFVCLFVCACVRVLICSDESGLSRCPDIRWRLLLSSEVTFYQEG